MSQSIFSDNLRRFRVEKRFTQEQAAERLGVSAQAVSRWECGNTLPDVLLLPEIAKLYGVTVDDLYRENAPAYRNYALRLLAVYEASGESEDFILAEREFMKLADPSPDDLRSLGVLYHYMMKRCAEEALRRLDEAAERAGDMDTQTAYSARQQKILLLSELGRSAESIAAYSTAAERDSGDPKAWLLLISAHYFAGEYERACELSESATLRFPDEAALHIYAGDSCRALRRYDEAFEHWNAALALDRTYLDARYSMGFCYEELGEYEKAYRAWTELADELERRGLTVEREFPLRLARACRAKLS